MFSPINLTVDATSVTLTATATAAGVTYTTTITTRPPSPPPPVHTETWGPGGGPTSMSKSLPAGDYHLHISGSDGTTVDSDFTIPTTPPRTTPLTPVRVGQ